MENIWEHMGIAMPIFQEKTRSKAYSCTNKSLLAVGRIGTVHFGGGDIYKYPK
ncbi:hypothetical protein KIN20_026186 [Parelaphostrongylus tenuis]|uniref:Uncharacterized protein n=1 Tax=Parelaphostrongylus tenuis TaxID=148309 RepID=A0AAD5NDN5_PARTN|nr:hypothetical protein KIN20_026186 [Parelaphostrongylus tenuis]